MLVRVCVSRFDYVFQWILLTEGSTISFDPRFWRTIQYVHRCKLNLSKPVEASDGIYRARTLRTCGNIDILFKTAFNHRKAGWANIARGNIPLRLVHISIDWKRVRFKRVMYEKTGTAL